MAPLNIKTLCLALGFTAVVLKGVPSKQQAHRAVIIAQLIETFCRTTPFLGGVMNAETIDMAIEYFKGTLRDGDETVLPNDRESLLSLFERLHQRKTYRANNHFYEAANNDTIKNGIIRFLNDEIELKAEGG